MNAQTDSLADWLVWADRSILHKNANMGEWGMGWPETHSIPIAVGHNTNGDLYDLAWGPPPPFTWRTPAGEWFDDPWDLDLEQASREDLLCEVDEWLGDRSERYTRAGLLRDRVLRQHRMLKRLEAGPSLVTDLAAEIGVTRERARVLLGQMKSRAWVSKSPVTGAGVSVYVLAPVGCQAIRITELDMADGTDLEVLAEAVREIRRMEAEAGVSPDVRRNGACGTWAVSSTREPSLKGRRWQAATVRRCCEVLRVLSSGGWMSTMEVLGRSEQDTYTYPQLHTVLSKLAGGCLVERSGSSSGNSWRVTNHVLHPLVDKDASATDIEVALDLPAATIIKQLVAFENMGLVAQAATDDDETLWSITDEGRDFLRGLPGG